MGLGGYPAEQQARIRLVSAITRTLFFILLMKYLLSEAFYKRLVYQSAKRTNESSPAVYCWDKELKGPESVKRTAE